MSRTRKKKVDLYAELKEGLEEMAAIEKGEKEPVRVHRFFTSADIKALRERAGASQHTFAAMLGVSKRTLQDWEQGRRTPTGPAMNLLRLYEAMPKATTRVLAKHPALAS
jgi:putative transcriptional regulator